MTKRRQTTDDIQLMEVIRERLILAMEITGWSTQAKLAEETHISKSSIGRWYNQDSLPTYAHLIQLADEIGTSVDWLLGRTDTFKIDNKQCVVTIAGEAYNEARKQIILNAQKSLLVQLRAGATIGWQGVTPLFEGVFEKKHISVKLLICDPSDECTVNLLYERRHTQAGGRDRVISDIKTTIDTFGEITSNLEVALLPYLPTSLVYIADHEEDRGEALSLYLSFKGGDIRDAPMIHTIKADHPDMFNFFVDDFNRYWEFAQNHQNGQNQQL